jgi:hypothetical protein
MDKPDSIASAEREVAGRRAVALAEYRALQTKLQRQASSPKVIGIVLIAATAIAYFVIAGRRKPKRVVMEKAGAWSQVLDTAKLVLPLVGALKAAKAAKHAQSAKKTVSKATGTPPVSSDAPESELRARQTV